MDLEEDQVELRLNNNKILNHSNPKIRANLPTKIKKQMSKNLFNKKISKDQEYH